MLSIGSTHIYFVCLILVFFPLQVFSLTNTPTWLTNSDIQAGNNSINKHRHTHSMLQRYIPQRIQLLRHLPNSLHHSPQRRSLHPHHRHRSHSHPHGMESQPAAILKPNSHQDFDELCNDSVQDLQDRVHCCKWDLDLLEG